MPPVVIRLSDTEDLRDVVHRTVEALSAGKVVAIPTETVYGLAASAFQPEAVKQVFAIKGRPANAPLAIAVKSLEDAIDFVPDMSPVARRIARRSWPTVRLVCEFQQLIWRSKFCVCVRGRLY